MIAHALAYAARGWPVLPCKPKDEGKHKAKSPLTPHGFKDASCDPETVRRLFAPHPHALIGVNTGKVSGFFVLDVDVKKNAGGEISLAELEREHGALPVTVEARSCSGGRHFYFSYPAEGIGCKIGVRPGLDIRGDGGYIIAPPSVAEGKNYEWVRPPESVPFADAPTWLIRLVKAYSSLANIDLSDGSKITANRNGALFSIAFKLRKAGLSAEDILSLVLKTNREKCIPPLSESETQTIAKSACRYPVDKLAGPYTDVWNAALLRELFGQDLRYSAQFAGWHVWDGKKWAREETGQVMRLAKQTVKRMFALAEGENNDKLSAHAKSSEAKPRLDAMIKLVESEDGIPAVAGDFDADGKLLNCDNGAFDLSASTLGEHRRESMSTRQIGYGYNPAAKCPRWLTFLDEIFQGDKELGAFMQRAAGYSLNGDTSEHCLFICYGTGRNGKSTFLKTIWRILGPYAAVTPASTLMERYDGNSNNSSQELAKLKGIRFVMASEGEKGQKLAEAQIKAMTGGEPISARFLYHKPFEYVPEFKIWLSTNYKPNISGTDQGIWSRIRLIPFNAYFGPETVDKNLDDKLMAEAEGILAWMVEGYRQWRSDGLGMPAVMERALDEYREKSDLLGSFIAECCELSPNAEELAGKLSSAAQSWARENGYKGISRNQMSDYLERHGIAKKRATSGVYVDKYVWTGIQLKPDMQPKQYGSWYDN
ncbi:MAG: phage/plasmid primase, P4 family [Elusimicrobiales bacterium]|nr:phage/plasmid primase, P4 family [Elusimicrobiales bacterium]